MSKAKTVEERIGTAVKVQMYQKLQKIARMLGRTKSDLLKEGIWEVINQQKTKN
jgi:predicted DNA-binding protein